MMYGMNLKMIGDVLSLTLLLEWHYKQATIARPTWPFCKVLSLDHVQVNIYLQDKIWVVAGSGHQFKLYPDSTGIYI